MAGCVGCGAALSLSDGPVVRCSYCGTDNRVAPDPPKPPPIVVVAPPQIATTSPARASSPRWLVVPALLIPLVAVGLQVLPKLTKRGAISLRGPLTWVSQGLCFVDANGDGALDPVGFGGRGGVNDRVRAVDGKSGVELWASAPFPDRSTLWCGDGGTALVAGGDFTLSALDGRTGAARWQSHLSDKVKEAVTRGECVAVTTDDEARFGFSLATGAEQQCDASKSAPHRRRHSFGDPFGAPPPRDLVRSGDLEIELTTRKPGTPLLVVTARRGDTVAWKSTLPAQEMTSDARFFFSSDGKVVVFGGALPGNNHLVIVGLDATTGQVAYTKNEDSPFSTSIFFDDARHEGPWIIAHWGSELHAYDPATGDQVW